MTAEICLKWGETLCLHWTVPSFFRFGWGKPLRFHWTIPSFFRFGWGRPLCFHWTIPSFFRFGWGKPLCLHWTVPATENTYKDVYVQMIRVNLAVLPYCFFVYAFVVTSNTLLTSSCTLHSRKFPTKPSVHPYKVFFFPDDFIGFI